MCCSRFPSPCVCTRACSFGRSLACIWKGAQEESEAAAVVVAFLSIMSSISFNALFASHFFSFYWCAIQTSLPMPAVVVVIVNERTNALYSCELNRIVQQNKMPNYKEFIGNMVYVHLLNNSNEYINAYLILCAVFNKLAKKMNENSCNWEIFHETLRS